MSVVGEATMARRPPKRTYAAFANAAVCRQDDKRRKLNELRSRQLEKWSG
jgi:hypothetical protein